MTKAELVAAMADKAGMNRAQAKEALEAFIASVTDALKSGEDVRLVGFGAFKAVQRPAGTARNPRTGATVKRPATKTCRFHAGDALKGVLN
ncbi:MAG TPA: HU family DNA-binding protein [Caulobacteraceae bacterium]